MAPLVPLVQPHGRHKTSQPEWAKSLLDYSILEGIPMFETPLQFGLDHFHWPFLIAAAWWARGVIMDTKATLEANTKSAADKADVVVSAVTNHLPTALGEQTKILQSVDKNIALLVDRGRHG